MSKITYVTGDATYPIGDGNKLLVHIVNNKNEWELGLGFVLALSKKWSAPEFAYRMKKKHDLGEVQFVRVTDKIIVANMVAQHGVKKSASDKPIRYDALRRCLVNVNDMAIQTNSSIHGPRFGAGLAGGDWMEIEKIINEVVYCPITIYDLK